MRTPSPLSFLLAASIALSLGVSGAALAKGGPGGGRGGPGTGGASEPVAALSEVEAADLVFMREEEKLARDVYLTLGEAWDNPTFDNVAASEQRHMNAMLKLLRSYELADPVGDNLIGEFTDPELQALFDTLVGQGLESEAAGLGVGGLIEEVDMEDIAAAIERSTRDDIDAVYESLLCGSRNHLRGFAGSLEALTGEPYVAQLLDQAEVDAILAAPREACGR